MKVFGRLAASWRAWAACAAAVLALALLLAPPAHADGGLSAAAAVDKYHQLEGTVYFSRSEDAKFCVSDGEDAGTVMAGVPVDLAEVCKVDLDDYYGLGKYKLAAPAGAGYSYECTLLQLFVYVAQRYSASGADGISLTGDARASYFARYWGADDNLLYYVNGLYPLDATLGPNMGATSDAIPLSDGDSVMMAHFSQRAFYTDAAAGLRFFFDGSGGLARDLEAATGERVRLRLARAVSDFGAENATSHVGEEGCTLWYGPAYDGSAGNGSALGSVTCGEDGWAQLSFNEPGTYYVWADGAANKRGMVVSSPALVRIKVTGEPVREGSAAAGVPEDAPGEEGPAVKEAQAANPMKVTAKAKTLKAKKLKKKAQKFKAITVKGAKGEVTFVKVKVNKKKYAKKFAVDRKTGKVTVKKGLKKGTYKLTVRVSASGNGRFGPATRDVAVKVKVR